MQALVFFDPVYNLRQRNPKPCAWCQEQMLIGDPTVYIADEWRGFIRAQTMHLECHDKGYLNYDWDDAPGQSIPGPMLRGLPQRVW